MSPKEVTPGKRLLNEIVSMLMTLLGKLGTTVAVITHNAAIAGMAGRVITLADGRIADDRVNETRLPAGEIEW